MKKTNLITSIWEITTSHSLDECIKIVSEAHWGLATFQTWESIFQEWSSESNYLYDWKIVLDLCEVEIKWFNCFENVKLQVWEEQLKNLRKMEEAYKKKWDEIEKELKNK